MTISPATAGVSDSGTAPPPSMAATSRSRRRMLLAMAPRHGAALRSPKLVPRRLRMEYVKMLVLGSLSMLFEDPPAAVLYLRYGV